MCQNTNHLEQNKDKPIFDISRFMNKTVVKRKFDVEKYAKKYGE